MSRPGPNTLPDERGVSDQVAVVLLVGLVITGSAIVLLTGSQALTQLEDQVRAESGEKALREVDSKLSSLAFEDNDTVSLDFGDGQIDGVELVRNGRLNVTVNDRHACSANTTLSSIRYRTSNGNTYAYEMGGMWLRTDDGSALRSPPSLRFDDGSLQLTVYNLTGSFADRTAQATKRVEPSENRTRRLTRKLYAGDCRRPDNVTVVVKSDFYRAWYGYLRTEVTAGSVTKHDGNSSVRVRLSQSALPAATNDSRNRVVDLNGSSYVDVNVSNNAVEVTKNASVEYPVTVTPLAKGTRASDLRSFEGETVFRPSLDVVFVIDESGSMSNPSDGVAKYKAARSAMRTFLGTLNDSRDRAGLVGFNTEGRYFQTNGHYLTGDFAGMNTTINTTDANSGTNTFAGMQRASRVLDLTSNTSREQVVILLSDGRNSDPDNNARTIQRAKSIAERGGTVYTIGFGNRGSLNEEFLTWTAQNGSGTYYYAANSSRLQEVFRDIAQSVTETRAVTRQPVSLNVSTSTATFYPQITGDTDHLANGTGPDGERILNVNDPEAPAPYSFTFTVDDGANLSLNALSYDCERWVGADETVTNTTTNETYTVVRCAELDESSLEVVSPSNVSIYRDGANVSTLLADEEGWWRADLRNETLLPYLENGTDTLDLPSNQAIVVFNYTADDGSASRILVRLTIGSADTTSIARNVVRISYNEIWIRDE